MGNTGNKPFTISYMNHQFFIGLMSGTSLDGMDAVLIDFGEDSKNIKIVNHSYVPYDDVLKKNLLALHTPRINELEESALIGNEITLKAHETIQALLKKTQIDIKKIKAVGFHGQTIRHQPSKGYTLQIGNPALLAELSGINVVGNFRSRDVAAGGQGAPLVPAFHKKIFDHPSIHRAVINIGGIANITNLPPKKSALGFDSGPGNLLLDYWVKTHLNQSFDNDGVWAKSGEIIPALLDEFMKDAYFKKTPPKSTGRDHFNEAWLNKHLQKSYSSQDVQRTLLEFTALSIAKAMDEYAKDALEIYLCGGGACNSFLVKRLESLIPNANIKLTDALGVPTQYLEATAFAWLAKQTTFLKPGNLPEVTGAKGLRILGAVYYA